MPAIITSKMLRKEMTPTIKRVFEGEEIILRMGRGERKKEILMIPFSQYQQEKKARSLSEFFSYYDQKKVSPDIAETADPLDIYREELSKHYFSRT